MLSFLTVAYHTSLIIVALSLCLLMWQKPGREQKVLMCVEFFITLVVIGFCVKIGADSLDQLILGQKILYMGATHLFFCTFLFFANFCGVTINRKIEIALISLNSVLTVLVFTCDKNTLFYKSYRMLDSEGMHFLVKEYGIFHTVYMIETLCFVAGIVFIMIKQGMRADKASFWRMFKVFLVNVISMVPYLTEKIIGTKYEFMPIGLAFSSITLMYFVYVDKIYDISDAAHQYVFASVDSGLIILDKRDGFRGTNSIAKELFPELGGLQIGDKLTNVSDTLANILKGKTTEFTYFDCIYESNAKPIFEEDRKVGTVIWLSDVTTRREYMDLVKNYQSELEREVDIQTKKVEDRNKKVRQMSLQMVETLANAIDAKDQYTNGHSSRVMEYSVMIARKMGMDEESIEKLRYKGLLHDIGKIGVPDEILKKMGKLTDDEYHIIQSHTVKGGNILKNTTMIPGAEDVARHHHERYDGHGYPDGLKGEEIPIEARIVGIADAFDAMNSNRIYRRALTKEKIRNEFVLGRGSQFDPDLLDIFLEMFDNDELVIEDFDPEDKKVSEEAGQLFRTLLDSLKNSESDAGLICDSRINLKNVAETLRTRGEKAGISGENVEDFAKLYEYTKNLGKRYQHDCFLSVITLDGGDGATQEGMDSAMNYMEDLIRGAIRNVDVCIRYGQDQLLIILLDVNESNVETVIGRIVSDFNFSYSGMPVQLSYDIEKIKLD